MFLAPGAGAVAAARSGWSGRGQCDAGLQNGPSLSAGLCVRFLSPFRRLGPGNRVVCSDSGSKAQVQLVGARRPRPNSITRPGRALGGLRHSSSSHIRWRRWPQRRVQATKSFPSESRLPSITRAPGACLLGGPAHHLSVSGPAARPGGLAAPAGPISSVSGSTAGGPGVAA